MLGTLGPSCGELPRVFMIFRTERESRRLRPSLLRCCSRGGKAVRLTYDHKGSDAHEAKRITDAGGFVMNNRVNGESRPGWYSSIPNGEAHPKHVNPRSILTGVLAVTRSLGDSSMKEFVVGAPYTTETALDSDDEFLIVACDGVRTCFFKLLTSVLRANKTSR